MKDKWFEIFRAGTHTDASGQIKEWTIQDLDLIVSNYNEQPPDNKHDAPIVLGHPESAAPAYGWVQSLKRIGTSLFAQFKDLNKDFIEAVKKGSYKKISISLYDDLKLRHVGFLGGMPPAIKGLEEVQFNEKTNKDNITIETIYNFLEGERMDLIAELLKIIKEEAGADVAANIIKRFEAIKSQKPPTQDQGKASAKTEQKAAFTEAEKNPEHEAMQKELENSKQRIKELEFSEMFNEALKNKQVIETQRNAMKDIYMNLNTKDFSEAKNILNGFLKDNRVFDYTEPLKTPNTSPDDNKFEARAKEIQEHVKQYFKG